MVCAVIDCVTNTQINLIVADLNDPPPDGCYLVEIPDGYFWNGTAVVPMPLPDLTLTNGD